MLQKRRVFIGLYCQRSDGKAAREVTKTSKQCKQVPRKWLNKAGGGGAKAKPGQWQRCCGEGRPGREGSAARHTHSAPRPPPALPGISSCCLPSHTPAQHRPASSSSSCTYRKNHIPPESQVRSMERHTKKTLAQSDLNEQARPKAFFKKLRPLFLLHALRTLF